jgi:hypothetical protein
VDAAKIGVVMDINLLKTTIDREVPKIPRNATAKNGAKISDFNIPEGQKIGELKSVNMRIMIEGILAPIRAKRVIA